MTENKIKNTRWAIIIGIDYYPTDRCLQGSVKDAMMVKSYLQNGESSIQITTLTATTPSDLSSGVPVEATSSWPNRSNVIQSLKRIIKEASTGDLVYIHYSGHGSRIPNQGQSESETTEELALVLFEADEIGESYFRGRHLAGALKQMVDKGLIVTLVLDCCFSGSVTRYGDKPPFDIRSVDYNPNVDTSTSRTSDEGFPISRRTSRDASAQQDWLVNPGGYTILSACGPYERAFEVEIEGQGRRGALTHLLLSILHSLKTSGIGITHQSLHAHLCAKFHCFWPQQTPMRYGNMNRIFFSGLVRKEDSMFIPIYRATDSRLCLRAGQAHGISTGDEFAAISFDTSEQATQTIKNSPRILKATNVGPFTSDLVETHQSLTMREVTTGWRAKLVRRASSNKVRVQIPVDLSEECACRDAAQDMLYLDLVPQNEAERCMFIVTINESNEYEVLDALHNKLHSLPTVPTDSRGAATKVLQVLRHVALFKYFEAVENRMPSVAFRKSFTLTYCSAMGQDGIFKATHGAAWSFTVRNTRDQPLYLYMFNLNPSWEITNVVSDSGGDSYLVLPPREGRTIGRRKVTLRMEIPEFLRVRGETQCEDIVKIFITNAPIPFPGIVLGKITFDTDGLGQQVRSTDNPLMFLSRLSPQVRGEIGMGGDEWATQNFIIRTTL